MAQFTFTLNNFHIAQTMAKHLDTDWVYFTVRVGSQMFGPTHKKIGDLNNGAFVLNWEFGPVEVAATDVVVITYQIVNHGHDDTGKQVSDDIAIAAKISAGLTGLALPTIPPVGVVLGAITAGLGLVDGLVSWIFGDGPNCDGIVLSDAITTSGTGLQQMTQGSHSHTETRSYIGPETPHGCGPDAQYSVTWSVQQLVTQPVHPLLPNIRWRTNEMRRHMRHMPLKPCSRSPVQQAGASVMPEHNGTRLVFVNSKPISQKKFAFVSFQAAFQTIFNDTAASRPTSASVTQ